MSLYNLTKSIVNSPNEEEAKRLIISNDETLNIQEYYNSIISHFIQKHETIIKKEDGNLVFDLNNYNDIWNIVFIAEYIKENDILYKVYNKTLSEITYIRNQLSVIRNKHKTAKSKEEHLNINNEYQNINNILFAKKNEIENMSNVFKTFYEIDWINLVNTKNEVHQLNEIIILKQAINIIHKIRNTIEHDNLDIDKVIKIDNDHFSITIPIEYFDGFNKGRIIAEKDDKIIVERTDKIVSPILEKLGYSIYDIKSFFYNVNPDYLSFLLQVFNNDAKKLYELPYQAFNNEFEKLFIFLKNDMEFNQNEIIHFFNIINKDLLDYIIDNDYSIEELQTLCKIIKTGANSKEENFICFSKLNNNALTNIYFKQKIINHYLDNNYQLDLKKIEKIINLNSISSNINNKIDIISYLMSKNISFDDSFDMSLKIYTNNDTKAFDTFLNKLSNRISIIPNNIYLLLNLPLKSIINYKETIKILMKEFNNNLTNDNINTLMQIPFNDDISLKKQLKSIEIINYCKRKIFGEKNNVFLNIGFKLDKSGLKYLKYLIDNRIITKDNYKLLENPKIHYWSDSLGFNNSIMEFIAYNNTLNEGDLEFLEWFSDSYDLDMSWNININEVIAFLNKHNITLSKEEKKSLLYSFCENASESKLTEIYNVINEFLKKRNKQIEFTKFYSNIDSVYNFKDTIKKLDTLDEKVIMTILDKDFKDYGIDQIKKENVLYLISKFNGNIKKIREFPIEFFTCNIAILDEMIYRYNSNISKSIFGIDNPKIIAALIYGNSVYSQYQKENQDDLLIDIDPITVIHAGFNTSMMYKDNINIIDWSQETYLSRFIVDGNQQPRDNIEMKKYILDKFRNACAHFRFKPVLDKNGNVVDDKIYIYDKYDESNETNFDFIIDIKDFVEITRQVEIGLLQKEDGLSVVDEENRFKKR